MKAIEDEFRRACFIGMDDKTCAHDPFQGRIRAIDIAAHPEHVVKGLQFPFRGHVVHRLIDGFNIHLVGGDKAFHDLLPGHISCTEIEADVPLKKRLAFGAFVDHEKIRPQEVDDPVGGEETLPDVFIRDGLLVLPLSDA